MMIKHWIRAARFRTLPLSLSGIVLGSLLALEAFDIFIFIGAILTAVSLQILSNFANDYGDGMRGTDDNRTGEARALQTGLISAKQMRNAIKIMVVICLSLAVGLIILAFGVEHLLYSLLFLSLSFVCVLAAIRYTMGKNPYGYRGLGDIFVFVFFGLVSIVGSYFLHAKTWDFFILLPAMCIGCLSVAVLNLNNLRDYHSDKAAKKYTMVVQIGLKKAKQYHIFLLVLAFVMGLVFMVLKNQRLLCWITLPIALAVIINHYQFLYKNKSQTSFDRKLKSLSLFTFLFSLIFGLVYYFAN